MEGLFEHFKECTECKGLVHETGAIEESKWNGHSMEHFTFCGEDCKHKFYLARLRFYGM